MADSSVLWGEYQSNGSVHHQVFENIWNIYSDTGEKTAQSAGEDVLKGKKCTLDELVLLKIIKQEPTIT